MGKLIPAKDDPTCSNWEAEDNVVMSRLLQSMERSISRTFMFSKSAKEIWDGVATSYSQKKNYARISELQTLIAKFQQSNQTI